MAPSAIVNSLSKAGIDAPWHLRLEEIERRLASGELKILFIIGMARSGTTWLSTLLEDQPAYVNLGETHLFSSYLANIPAAVKKYRDLNVGIHRACPPEEFLCSIRDLVLRTFLTSVPSSITPAIVVEKTPPNTHLLEFIHQILPEAYFLHVVRDPRAVAASWNAAGRSWGKNWARRSSIYLGQHWKEATKNCEKIEAMTNRYYLLRYESLRAEPAKELEAIHSWLGMEVSRAECEKVVQECTLEKLRGDKKEKCTSIDEQFFRRGEIDGWRRELTKRQIARIEYATRANMTKYGYQPMTKSTRFMPSFALFRTIGRLEGICHRILQRLGNTL